MTTPLDRFITEINKPDPDIDLSIAALYIAQIEYPDLDIDRYLRILDSMGTEVAKRLPET
jgi:regulator of sirC expression with transglutaminase-like and TPR domain